MKKPSRKKASPRSFPKKKNQTITPKENLKQESAEIRLNRYISNSGICSRREADKLIADGEVKVNGKVVMELGTKVGKDDRVEFKGKVIQPEKYVYLLLNKPKGFITTLSDPKDRKTVMELVSKATEQRIYPVGRLDRMTTGVLLFTNDGDFAQKLIHPSMAVPKIYEVVLNRALKDEDLEKIKEGTELEDGVVKVDDIAIVSSDAKSVGVKIHSGKNRVIRRLFEHYHYQVEKLDRVMFAGLDKKGISRGQWRYLSEKEIIRLKYFQ
ncbi:rRNA pseudouridine synthase [Hyphobacterium sp. CCMP332]|nr:rRNA pseudouridine synthase [Hyphobacterium sp. CCMP332]